jgi:hypothetical protein
MRYRTPTLIPGRVESTIPWAAKSPLLAAHPVMVSTSPVAAASAVRLAVEPIVDPHHPLTAR